MLSDAVGEMPTANTKGLAPIACPPGMQALSGTHRREKLGLRYTTF